MLQREVQDFVRVTLALQKTYNCCLEQAKVYASTILGCTAPGNAAFDKARSCKPVRARGRPSSTSLTPRDAVAAVAVYFESVGARPGYAIKEAKGWLGNVKLSRRVAMAAVKVFKGNTSPEQYQIQAQFAYAKLRGQTLPLPDSMIRVPKAKKKRTRARIF